MGGDLLIYGVVLLLVVKLINMFWWQQRNLQKSFEIQGIKGPKYWPLIGSIAELVRIYKNAAANALTAEHSVLQSILPHIPIWTKTYGRVYLYWLGTSPRLTITDPELIKEIIACPRKYDQSIDFPLMFNLLRGSVLAVGGELWVTQRRFLSSFFHVGFIKRLPDIAIQIMEERVKSWSNGLKESDTVELDVQEEFQILSQSIIAEVVFGSDAEEGFSIAQLQAEQAVICFSIARKLYIPGLSYLPTPTNRRSKWLRQEVDRRFQKIITKRDHNDVREREDLLGLMLVSDSMSRKQIIDECSVLVAAGSESTTLLLTWTCILMAVHVEWQDKAREEIREVLKGKRPTAEILSQLKVLNMIINEALRLYPPIPFLSKKAKEDIKVGDLKIPAGVHVELPVMALHYDTQLWGENAEQFDPNRFAEGLSKTSKHPMSFLPFSNGPRVCIGMNFGLLEARILLAIILSNFRLSISPRYKHSPICDVTLKPGNGALILFQKAQE